MELEFEGNFAGEDRGEFEGDLVADGTGSGEGGVVVGHGCPVRPGVFLSHEVGVVAMLADGVATLAWNHRTDDGIEAVDGGFEEDALVYHHTHDVRPRPIFLFRRDFLVYLADNLNQLLRLFRVTETRLEVTRHLVRVDFLTFTQASEQLACLVSTVLLVAPPLYEFDVGASLSICSFRLSNA